MNSLYNIAAVERDTGLSKDVLRVWERRYGFPVPARDANGDRVYPVDQVDRLRLIKRLMDQGHRPGKLLVLTPEELLALGPRRVAKPEPDVAAAGLDELKALIDLIRIHDAVGYQQAMQQRLAREGLLRFVEYTVAPLTIAVGHAWETGNFAVYEEHLFTELTKRLLRQAMASLPGGRGVRVLLTTVPDERHVLGLLMVEAVLALEGAQCIPLGPQMPLLDIVAAAVAHQADVVALSFSAAYPQRQIPGVLQQLRAALPDSVQLWAGGSGVAHLPPIAGVDALHSLADARVTMTRCAA